MLFRSSAVTTNDIYTGWGCHISGLDVSASIGCNGTIGIPGSLAPGQYYLAAIADTDNAVIESDKTNNVRDSDSGPITLTAGATTPNITSVSPILPQQTQTITITGTGFGTQQPYTGDSSYIQITDTTANWAAGLVNNTGSNTVGLNVTSWTDSQITLAGFQGAYGQSTYVLQAGDQVQVKVWNAPTGAGPAAFPLTVLAASSMVVTDVENGASFLPGFSQGSWISIKGANLSGTTRIWTVADFNGVNLPTQLDQVSVTVDGKPAFVY